MRLKPTLIGFGVVLIAIGLAGCTGTTRAEFNEIRTAFQDPVTSKEVIKECIADADFTEMIRRNKYDKLLGSSLKQAQRVFCRRIINAVASGKLRFEDGEAIRRGDDSKFRRILLGR